MKRIDARLLAGFLLLDLVLVSGAGWFGWQQYDEHRDTQRLRQAERDLASLALPEDWSPVSSPGRCFVDAQNRCSHSTKSPQELRAELIALLHGREEGPYCPAPKVHFPCSVFIRGTVNGYLAVASAAPDFYYPDLNFPQGLKPPASAKQVVRPANLDRLYVDGTLVSITLVPDPSILVMPGG